MATAEPFHLTKTQGWATDQVTQHHLEALYAFGEYAMFVLMWIARDFEQGLVDRCPTCFVGKGRVARAYDQGAEWKCPDCFGTTFEGGYRARLIRPALVTDRTTDVVEAPRGQFVTDSVTIESTEDFTLRHGDYCFRKGNLRYQCEEKGVVVVRSGFAYPDEVESVAGTISSARLEAPQAVAYLIPPDAETLDLTLSGPVVQGAHITPELAQYEEIRGPVMI